MRGKVFLALVCAMLCAGFMAQAAGAAEVRTLAKQSPLTQAQKDRIHAAGAEGVQMASEELNLWCPGYQQPGVSAAGCIVEPAGCTANFIFTDGTSKYVGTARHCVDKVGDRVIMQVDTTTLADVGSVVKITPGEDVPGRDFALIKIDPAVAAKWGVNPAIPVVGGPQGIYDGCAQQPVKNYGHGYAATVAQGKPQGGLGYVFYDDGYGWAGNGLPGDSGSPVVLAADNRSVGNFTHIILADLRGIYVPGTLTGMRTTEILEFLGGGFALVNADGSTSYDSTTACPQSGYDDSGAGAGSGGGGGKGGKGGKPRRR